MKKLFSLFIALIYLATSSGLALQVHYCMDEVTGMSLVENEDNTCDECGMEKAANPCCKDELKFLKLQDAHKLLVTDIQLQAPIAVIQPVAHMGIGFFIHSPAKLFSTHSPPLVLTTSLNILHCIFRI